MKNTTNKRVRVVLADDHDLVRSGIKALLEMIDGVEVIAEARNGQELVTLVADLQQDPMVRFQHRHYLALALVFGALLPMAIGTLWGDPWGALLVAGFLRLCIQWHATFCINSLTHMFGSQPYSKRVSARDSFWIALLTFGEGYHNYHHEFQHDYRNGVKPWQWDPSKWTIWTLSKLGLADSLRRVPDSKILLAEMREARRKAELHLEEIRQQQQPGQCQRASDKLHELVEKLATNYHELENAISERVQLSREALNRWQNETRGIMREISRIQLLTPA